MPASCVDRLENRIQSFEADNKPSTPTEIRKRRNEMTSPGAIDTPVPEYTKGVTNDVGE